MEQVTVRTSEQGWITKVADAYQRKAPLLIVDDAQVGIDPRADSILTMGRKGKLTGPEWVAALAALGVAGTGAFLVIMAVVDPEPFSKIGFALGAGAVMTLGGGGMAVHVLTKNKPPNIRLSPRGFEISWS